MRVAPPGWSPSPSAAVAAIALQGRAGRQRRCASSSSRSSSPTSRCRAERARDPRAGRRAREPPLESEEHVRARAARASLVHRTKHSELRMAAAMDHVIEGARPARRATAEAEPDFGRLTSRPSSSPASRSASSSSSPTAGRRGARCRRCATRSARRWPRPGTPAGTTRARRSASTSTTSGSGPTSRSRATPSCSRRVRFGALPRAAGGRARRGPRDPGQGADRPGYDGHAFWDTETFVLPMLDLRGAGGGARRAALAPRDARQGAATAPQQLGLEGAAFPWRTITRRRVLRLLARRHRRLPHQRRHRPRGRPLHRRDRRRRTSSATSALELLVETARLWRSLGHHDAHGAFRIDGVTGPDEYTRGRRQQRLHQPRGAAEPARRRRRRRAPRRTSPTRSGSTTRRWPPGATPPTR